MMCMSLPAWECGLKSKTGDLVLCLMMSLPAWECGLKLKRLYRSLCSLHVTPCVGVWIEILMEAREMKQREESLPAWECGLKS